MIINPYNIATEGQDDEPIISTDKIEEENITFLINNYNTLLEKGKYDEIKKVLHSRFIKQNKKISISGCEEIINKVLNKIFGYGILQKYIEDIDTTDIRIVKHDQIYIKAKGIWTLSNESFQNDEELNDFVRYSILKNGAVINHEQPIIVVSDRRNHLRIEAGIDPVNVKSASMVIRMHKNASSITLESLFAKEGMINKDEYLFLDKSVEETRNILIVGKGGSGKTTLLRAILNKLPKEMPITTNEETAELYLENRNVIQREVVFRKDEFKSIDLEKLTRHSLVMSNDAIVIGELKGKEANTFFDAISTGHIGYTTVHADSIENSIDRIIVLIKKDIKAQGYSDDFLRNFISSSIDYIVYMQDFSIKEIARLKYDSERNKFIKQLVVNKNNEGEIYG